MKKILFLIVFIFIESTTLALTTEISLSYSRKKTTFDENNYIDTESGTGSLSFYFWEIFALETSYTNAIALREEKASDSDDRRTIIQTTKVVGADLIWIISRGGLLQPYLKAGIANLQRSQEFKIEGQSPVTLEPETAIIPSYGAGLKIMMSQTFSLKMSYDVWRTPVTDSTYTNDAQLRAGLSWML